MNIYRIIPNTTSFLCVTSIITDAAYHDLWLTLLVIVYAENKTHICSTKTSALDRSIKWLCRMTQRNFQKHVLFSASCGYKTWVIKKVSIRISSTPARALVFRAKFNKKKKNHSLYEATCLWFILMKNIFKEITAF